VDPGGNQNGPAPTFAQQRLIYFALLLGMTMYAIAIAVVVQTNGGQGLSPELPVELDWIVPAVAASLTLAALLVRGALQRGVEGKTGPARAQARFRATLVPVAMLEGGCLLALTVWMMSGQTVPHLVTAMVILAIAIAIVPFSDPDR
jgi:hypothetical protein